MTVSHLEASHLEASRLEAPELATPPTATATGTAVRGRVRTWTPVCAYTDLLPERGACALVDGHQIAIFRTFDGALYAIGNRDPFSGAYVLSRGIVGTRRGEPTVASPMYKQVFSLDTGRCLDTLGYEPVGGADPDLPVWRARVVDGDVWLEPTTGEG